MFSNSQTHMVLIIIGLLVVLGLLVVANQAKAPYMIGEQQVERSQDTPIIEGSPLTVISTYALLSPTLTLAPTATQLVATEVPPPSATVAPSATPLPTEPPPATNTPAPPGRATPGSGTQNEGTLSAQLAPIEIESSTATVVPTPTLLTTLIASEHYWFERPIPPEFLDRIELFYPYSATGEGLYPVHHGVEFMNELGTPILAVAPGTVIVARSDHELDFLLGPHDRDLKERGPFYGNVIVIEHDQPYNGQPLYSLYAHLDTILTQEGAKVKTSEQIATVGMSGIAGSPHLHFEVRVGKNDYHNTRNPLLWIKPHEGNGTVIGKLLDAEGQPIPGGLITIARPNAEQTFQYEYTYVIDEVNPTNPDDEWNENFLLGDIPEGEWRVVGQISKDQEDQEDQKDQKDQFVVKDIFVTPGQTTWVWLNASGE